MKRFLFLNFIFLGAFISNKIKAQELRANVSILSPQVQMTNKEIFTTLETAIREFVNSYRWTDLKFEENERLDCSFIFTIATYNPQSNAFAGTLQVQYSRPIFNSAYNSPLINFTDNDLRFSYIINQQLEYQPNNHISNLTSLLAYYAYLIIGLDQASFIKGGGDAYFAIMQQIVSNAQNDASATGWRSFDGNKARFWLSDNLNSPAFKAMVDGYYNYHRLGMDQMSETNKQGDAKSTIKDVVLSLQDIWQKRPNALLITSFFDAKSDEIVSIFSGGPELDISKLKEVLQQIDAGRSNKYDTLGKR